MQCHPSGKRQTTTTRKGCQPRRLFRRPGTFTGSFRFIGEGEYTTAEANKVRGSVATQVLVFCSSVETYDPQHPKPPPSPYLTASTANHALDFGAVVDEHHHNISLWCNYERKAGSLSIVRYLTSNGPASDFSVAPRLSNATATPPPPFSGSAALQRQARGVPPSWAGSLSASFPGKPPDSPHGSGVRAARACSEPISLPSRKSVSCQTDIATKLIASA